MCSTVQLSRSCCRMTAPIFYHTVLSLSRTFLKSFVRGEPFFATAMIDYHIFKALSTTFFKKFLTGGFSSALSRDSYDRIAHGFFYVKLFFNFLFIHEHFKNIYNSIHFSPFNLSFLTRKSPALNRHQKKAGSAYRKNSFSCIQVCFLSFYIFYILYFVAFYF